eukprot:1777446-Amphidinium_carterae.1
MAFSNSSVIIMAIVCVIPMFQHTQKTAYWQTLCWVTSEAIAIGAAMGMHVAVKLGKATPRMCDHGLFTENDLCFDSNDLLTRIIDASHPAPRALQECRRAMGFSTHIHECVALK